jgi:hypothetical protein
MVCNFKKQALHVVLCRNLGWAQEKQGTDKGGRLCKKGCRLAALLGASVSRLMRTFHGLVILSGFGSRLGYS